VAELYLDELVEDNLEVVGVHFTRAVDVEKLQARARFGAVRTQQARTTPCSFSQLMVVMVAVFTPGDFAHGWVDE